MEIIFLASYPRSGNTWIRFLLHHYFYEDVKHSSQINERIPDLHDMLANDRKLDTSNKTRLFVKTHFRYTPAHQYFKHAVGVIYVLRHPRDVIMSNSRYILYDSGHREDHLKVIISNLGVPGWRKQGMGTYPENIGSWMTVHGQMPVLFIKYEDLLKNTENVLEE